MMLKQPAAELMSPYHWLKCKLYFINIFYKQKTEIILFPFLHIILDLTMIFVKSKKG